MSVNRKLTRSNGRMSLNSKSGKSNEASNESNSSLRKCKKKKPYFVWGFLGVVALGIVWFFISSHSDSFLLRKGKRLGDCEERARILFQRHNISKKQLHAFVSFFSVSDQILSQCIDERRVQKLLSSDLGNNLQMIFSENREFHKEHTGVTGQIELMEQCPVDSVQRNLESLLLMEKTVSLAPYSAIMSNFVNNLLHGKNIVQSWVLELIAIQGYLTLCIGYWWILVVITICCRLADFPLFWNQKLVSQPKQSQHSAGQNPKGAGSWRKKLLVTFVLLGIVVSVGLFWHLNNNMCRRKEMLTNMCDERACMLQDQFNVSMNTFMLWLFKGCSWAGLGKARPLPYALPKRSLGSKMQPSARSCPIEALRFVARAIMGWAGRPFSTQVAISYNLVTPYVKKNSFSDT